MEAGRYPFPTVVGEEGTGGEWFESVRRALRWNTRGAMQGGFGSRFNGAEMAGVDEEEGEGRGEGEGEGGDGEEDEEEEWDITADPFDDGDEAVGTGESAVAGPSEGGSVQSGYASPLRRAVSGLGLD